MLCTGEVNPFEILFYPVRECWKLGNQGTDLYGTLDALPVIPFFRPRATIASSLLLLRRRVGQSRQYLHNYRGRYSFNPLFSWEPIQFEKTHPSQANRQFTQVSVTFRLLVRTTMVFRLQPKRGRPTITQPVTGRPWPAFPIMRF